MRHAEPNILKTLKQDVRFCSGSPQASPAQTASFSKKTTKIVTYAKFKEICAQGQYPILSRKLSLPFAANPLEILTKHFPLSMDDCLKPFWKPFHETLSVCHLRQTRLKS